MVAVTTLAVVLVSLIDFAARFTVRPVAVIAPASTRSCVASLIRVNVPPVELLGPRLPTRLPPAAVERSVPPALLLLTVNVPVVNFPAAVCVIAPAAVRFTASAAVPADPTVKPAVDVPAATPSTELVTEPIAKPLVSRKLRTLPVTRLPAIVVTLLGVLVRLSVPAVSFSTRRPGAISVPPAACATPPPPTRLSVMLVADCTAPSARSMPLPPRERINKSPVVAPPIPAVELIKTPRSPPAP